MIIDAFTFFNEKELVELRIKYLNELIDCFVVIEADVTYTGKAKKWNFPNILNNNLKEFSHKIQYYQMKIDLEKAAAEQDSRYRSLSGTLSTVGRSWKIENMQRNFIKNACKKFSPNDVVIISDLDEIPSREKISFVKSCDFKVVAPIAFEQALFHLDCNFLNLERWIGSVVTTKELIDKFGPQSFRNYRERISHFTDAGWSFSSFGGYERVKEKIESYAHSEHNNDKFKNPEHIAHCQRTGTDLFHRKVKSRKVEKNFFPKDLLIFMEQNPKFYFGVNT